MNFSRDPSAVFGANSERPYGSITRGVAIHPFLNGNGRWARMLANIWLKRNGHPITEWPEATISFKSVIRDEYLAAIRLHARRIVRTFAKATAERKIPRAPWADARLPKWQMLESFCRVRQGCGPRVLRGHDVSCYINRS